MLPVAWIDELVETVRNVLGDSVRSIVLYGSFARGEQTGESDIDIAVFLRCPMSKPERNELLSRLVDLDWKYGREFSVNDIEQENFDKWADVIPYFRAIKKEGVVLWKAA